MPTRTVSLALREAFRCSGQQFDAILQFAQERGLEELPFCSVVLEWRRVVTLARTLDLHREGRAE